MIVDGGRAAGTLRYRTALSLRYRLSLLLGEVAVGSADLARIGLVGAALGLQTLVLFSPGHFRPATNAFFAVVVCLGTLLSLGASWAAGLGLRTLLGPGMRRALGIGAMALLGVLSCLGVWQGATVIGSMTAGTPYSNDGAVMDLYAARQTLHHHNPYVRTNIVVALASINASATTTTPLMDGQFRGARAYPSEAAMQQVFYNVLRYQPRSIPSEFESKYNYPAGSFLFILPFVWAGMHDMRGLYLLAIVLMGAYLWYRMPGALRPLAPFVILSSVPLIVLGRGGQPDPIYGFFLMVGLAEWDRKWVSPAFVGIAAATKQLTWFFLPFYLIFVYRRYGAREAARRSALIAAVYVVTNGPFFLQSPSGYIASISGPMSDPMFPLGIGFIALFVANVLPMLPKLAFTVAEIGSLAVATLATLRARWITPASAVALAALPLFFAWRSLVNYFYLVPLLALAVALTAGRDAENVAGT